MPVRKLSVGMRGPDVKAVQEALNVWGAKPPLDPDGKFGPKTDTAVRKFQKAHGLQPIDGIVGRDTRRALFPIGVATTTIYGMRLRMPEFPSFHGGTAPSWPGPLTLDPPPPPPPVSYELTRFPRLSPWLPAPRVPDWNSIIPPLSSGPSPPPFGFVYDRAELAPGGQSTSLFGGARQDAFTLTMQNVYLRGPDKGAHQEGALGVQILTPITDPNGPWTINGFFQLTDVDRFGSLGAFHWWQPYAQAGFQFMGRGNPQPALTANVCPVNLGLDIGNVLTVTLADGLALTMDLNGGPMQAGNQLSAGLNLKLGKPNTPLF
jgi:Putative peptidoglycan binding domain